MLHLELWKERGETKKPQKKSQTFRERQRTEQKLELFY